MSQSGRINFSRMESVTFGKPAAEVVAEEARKVGAERVFLMVSNTLTIKPTRLRRYAGRLGTCAPGPTTPCRRTRRAAT